MLSRPREAGPIGADEILGRFVEHAAALGLSLYPAQEEAILELCAGKHVVLTTPTGSGKSLVAEALCFKALCEGKVAFWTAPIKALVNEKFFDLCKTFGPENVGMMTGDAAVNRDAPVVCCTAEILSNLALREHQPKVDAVVMDEFHYYADRDRGAAWQVPLLALDKAQFLLMSATLGDTIAIEEGLRRLTGREVAAVRGFERPVPLEFEYREAPLHETIEELVASGRAPVYVVNFTQRSAAEQAQALTSANVTSKEEKEAIRAALDGARFDTPFGKDLQRIVRHGIGIHHAGLLPRYRRLVERLAQAGTLKIVSGTDTLGAGVNLPIRTVLFTQLCKFDGEKVAILRVRDFLQIAGRAGRKGFDERGYVVAQAPEHVIENKRIAEKQAAGKKAVKKGPPQKGYVHWDKNTLDKLVRGVPEPLESRFEVTHGMLVNLLQARPPRRGGGYGKLVDLIALSHGNEGSKRILRRSAAQKFRALRKAGIVGVVQDYGIPHVIVEPALQRDFSLHHTLALYLLDTLPRLDPASPAHALDVLSVVESILEDPEPILWKQLDKLKGEKVAELKARGVEYEDRMAELEKMEWPKPLREMIYQTFNAFADAHPWVGAENIHPKSVAREMVEQFASFNDYVAMYGLQRHEGLLLRYLSEAYKTLVQSVPESFHDERVEDVIAHLRLLVRGVDSSLIDEWESLSVPAPPAAIVRGDSAPVFEMKRFLARVRGELHRVLKALAGRDYAGAAALVRGEWSAERIEAEMATYWSEHASIDLTPRARLPHNTLVREIEPRVWEARQKILDPEGDEDWMLDCVVDLRAPRGADEPFCELRRIGV